MKTSPQSFNRENEETVWHTRKQRQETEKDIQLMKNRLKLLKRGDAQLSKRIDETKKKTMSMIELKKQHHDQIEQKKQNQKNDEESLKDKQKSNYGLKKQQEEQLEMIKRAMEQIKFDEHQRIKELSKRNAEIINRQKQDFMYKNKEKREHIKEIMHKSKSNISLYWNEKLQQIQKENEKAKLDNKKAQEQNKALQVRMEIEESQMMEKLIRSQAVQKKLEDKLNKAKNLPHDEFHLLLEEEGESSNNQRTNKSVEVQKWLPTPEKDMTALQNLETEPKQDTDRKDENDQEQQD